MGKQSGYYIEWTTKEGKRQKGAVYHNEQESEFINAKKLFIRLVDDQFKPTGGAILKSPLIVKLDVIGYFD